MKLTKEVEKISSIQGKIQKLDNRTTQLEKEFVKIQKKRKIMKVNLLLIRKQEYVYTEVLLIFMDLSIFS